MCLYLAFICQYVCLFFFGGSNADRVNEHYPKKWTLLKNKRRYVCFIEVVKFCLSFYKDSFILRATFVTATDNVSYPSFVLMCGLLERAVLEFARID